jgi:hypothetical protein
MNRKHGAQVVQLATWRLSALRARRDHLFESHLAAREVADGLHMGNGNAVGLPLGDCSGGHCEVSRQGGGAALLCSKPCVQVHGASLVRPKPESQGISKPIVFSIRLSMDDERRRRFENWFAGPPFRGDRSRLIEKTKYSKGRVSQFFDPEQPFGERTAKELAKRLGLPESHFLVDGGVTPQRAIESSPSIEITEQDLSDLRDMRLVMLDREIEVMRERAKHIRQQQRSEAAIPAPQTQLPKPKTIKTEHTAARQISSPLSKKSAAAKRRAG